MRNFFYSLIILIIALFFWISIFEFISTWWVEKYGDPLDKTKHVLVADRYLGWRQKPNFKGKFLNIALKTNEIGLRNKSFSEISNSFKNILVLGPSSSFGWGVEGYQTYSSVLENLLRNKYPGSGINVINAGQIGFSSWQGTQLYKEKEFRKLKIDVLIIAYGVNDVDRYRFFYASHLADKEEFAVPKRAWEVSLQNFLLRFNFINLLSRKIVGFFDNYRCSHQVIPTRRVSNDDFSRNIEKLIRMGELNGARVILLNSAYDLPSLKKINSEAEKIFYEYFNAARSKYEKKQYSEALTYFKKAAKINPDDNGTYYYLSSCYSYLGRCNDAKEMFEKARQSEPSRIASDIEELNNILRKVADKNGAILVDTKECLSVSGIKGMFLDPIHFSVMGNERLAEKISDVIQKHDLLRTDKKRKSND